MHNKIKLNETLQYCLLRLETCLVLTRPKHSKIKIEEYIDYFLAIEKA